MRLGTPGGAVHGRAFIGVVPFVLDPFVMVARHVAQTLLRIAWRVGTNAARADAVTFLSTVGEVRETAVG